MNNDTEVETVQETSRDVVKHATNETAEVAVKEVVKRATGEAANGTREQQKGIKAKKEARVREEKRGVLTVPTEVVVEEDSGGIFVYVKSSKYDNDSGRAKLFVSHDLVPHLATKNNAHKTESFCWWVNVPNEASKLIGERYCWPNKALIALRDIVNPTNAASSKSGGINMYKELCFNRDGAGMSLADHFETMERWAQASE